MFRFYSKPDLSLAGHANQQLNGVFSIIILKLINNSSSLNEGNHDRDGVWISEIFVTLFLRFLYIKHSRQCSTTFLNTSKFVKNTPLCVVLSTPFSVFENAPGQTRSFVFDLVHLDYLAFPAYRLNQGFPVL